MQSDNNTQNRQTSVSEFGIETSGSANCPQIRAKLDQLFSGRFPLEKMDGRTKFFLFRHLENCRDCCRSFDVRAHFRPTGRATIY